MYLLSYSQICNLLSGVLPSEIYIIHDFEIYRSIYQGIRPCVSHVYTSIEQFSLYLGAITEIRKMFLSSARTETYSWNAKEIISVHIIL